MRYHPILDERHALEDHHHESIDGVGRNLVATFVHAHRGFDRSQALVLVDETESEEAQVGEPMETRVGECDEGES